MYIFILHTHTHTPPNVEQEDNIRERELARHKWLIPAILATWEAEIWRIEARPGKWFLRPHLQNNWSKMD
jgi:hypothetical protein